MLSNLLSSVVSQGCYDYLELSFLFWSGALTLQDVARLKDPMWVRERLLAVSDWEAIIRETAGSRPWALLLADRRGSQGS